MDMSIDGEICSAKSVKGYINKKVLYEKTRIDTIYNSVLCVLCALCG
jgi:hypothetical protein